MPTHLFLTCWMLLVAAPVLNAANPGKPAEYLGGTLPGIEAPAGGRLVVSEPHELVFLVRKQQLRIPFHRINQLEYGQKAGRRVVTAIVVSPLFLLTKKRTHYLTIGYEDEAGGQQALVFRVPKNEIRTLLVSLEARTGRKVEYQDEEARKAGKG
ncbi:MAG: hypothetical protein KJZ84_14245 [Bryobacteraceae bacterium]|nr:hypothetical protein [Bryobacteraceae bacterium]